MRLAAFFVAVFVATLLVWVVATWLAAHWTLDEHFGGDPGKSVETSSQR